MLAQVLRPLSQTFDYTKFPNLLVGLQTSDDAAVWRLDDEHAIVQTVDYFPPIVDDPYTFGTIAAANAMSDVYAMGGEVLFACLNESVVGTVALKLQEPGVFELTKMAVDEPWQGRGFGRRLLESATRVAKQRGASKLILYSQRSLGAAIHLYRSCGFDEMPLCDQRYARCDIKMQRAL